MYKNGIQILIHTFIISLFLIHSHFSYSQSVDTIIKVVKCTDFKITGDGSSANWNQAKWIILNPLQKGPAYETLFKIMYSDSGIYCLYKNEDSKITASLQGDFLDIFNEDVVEAFFWTDQSVPLYFEYELSPLNFELPILVPNFKGKYLGWRPWHYEGSRKTRHAVYISRDATDKDNIKSWTAEFFIPFELLKPLQNVPPKKGMQWRANFYRIDYDKGHTGWSWQPVNRSYHETDKYGTILFE